MCAQLWLQLTAYTAEMYYSSAFRITAGPGLLTTQDKELKGRLIPDTTGPVASWDRQERESQIYHVHTNWNIKALINMFSDVI